MLLLTLHRRGVPATLYEREAGVDSRAHLGGCLDLGWETGQRALRENGLQQVFEQNSRPEGDEFKLCNAAAEVLLSKSTNEPKDPTEIRPEIDRSVLRRILLDACPADSIKWGHILTAVKPLEGRQHELTFANGATSVCDILIGADGARSQVRPLVSPATPLYTGVTGAEISLAPDIVTRPDMADIRELVKHGSLLATEKSKLLGVQMNGDGRIRTYAWFRGPADWALPLVPNRKVIERARVHSSVVAMLDQLQQRRVPPIIDLQQGLPRLARIAREHVPGVILIDDAAHPMSPFACAGANLAMLDGLKLGLVLAEAITGGRTVKEREAAVEVWEQKTFPISGKIASITKENLDAFIHSDAPQSAVDRAKSFLAAGRNEAEPQRGEPY